jgi:hypothetical protein
MVGANPDALSAVYAPFMYYVSLAVSHPDSFGGAAFYAVHAAPALVLPQANGMVFNIHKQVSIPSVMRKSPLCG